MSNIVSRQETDPAVCGRCGGMAFVRDSVRYCSGCARTTVGCACTGDRKYGTTKIPSMG